MRRRLCLLVVALTSVTTPLYAQREVSPEARHFRALRDGVFTIFGDQGHGTGFLIRADGLVVTNQHVIANSKYVRVQVNDSVKVVAEVLYANASHDVAVLRIHPSVTQGLPVLRLAPQRPELAFEGERVIAIGSPLNQQRIVTSGIVSKVERDALISDVNINPGNSGGPLINMDGEVIAINTFADASGSVGPGVSGSISIYLAQAGVDSAQRMAETREPPSARRMTVMPQEPFPLAALEAVGRAATWDAKPYNVTKQIYGGTGNFVMEIFTPLSLYRIQTEMARQVAQARVGRERAGGASAAESFSPFDDLFSWAQYVGAYSPVVLLRVAPKVGETTGSSIGNVIAAAAAGYSGTAYYGSHRLEFKGDLKDMRIENTNQVDEISRGMTFIPLVLDESTMWATYSGTDLARAGLLVLPLEMFAPAPVADLSGATNLGWPAVTVVVEDLKRQPVSEQRFIVPRVTVEQVWVDFAAYREQLSANAARLNLPGTPR